MTVKCPRSGSSYFGHFNRSFFRSFVQLILLYLACQGLDC